MNLAGTLEPGRHILPIRIYYEDTDFTGAVYHGGYVRFMERGRTDLLRLLGLGDHSTLYADAAPLAFVVRSLTIHFRKPGRMDDIVEVETTPGVLRGASMILMQRVLRGPDVLADGEAHIACVRAGRPVRLPEPMRARFAAFAAQRSGV